MINDPGCIWERVEYGCFSKEAGLTTHLQTDFLQYQSVFLVFTEEKWRFCPIILIVNSLEQIKALSCL